MRRKQTAKQTNKALLLSAHAQINTKPELEIFANDVRCTHGAAVGQMDEEAIFYLRSRGLGNAEARKRADPRLRRRRHQPYAARAGTGNRRSGVAAATAREHQRTALTRGTT